MTRHATWGKAWIFIGVIGVLPLMGALQSIAVEPSGHALSVPSSAPGPIGLEGSSSSGGQRRSQHYGQVSRGFEANLGQMDAQVQYLARGPGYNLWLTPAEAVLRMHDPVSNPALPKRTGNEPIHDQVSNTVLRIALMGANPNPRVTGEARLPGVVNYYVGNDPSRWRAGVPLYAKVRYEEVYPGIALVYYWNEGQLEYDFIIAPGADPRQIRLEVAGAESIRHDKEGTLQLTTVGGEIQLHRPRAYQVIDGSQKDIAARYVWTQETKTGNSKTAVSIQVADHDANQPLIIDPVLTYSTYLGGTNVDQGGAIAVDSSGHAYLTGTTQSTDFPPVNPAQPNSGGSVDAFVTKFETTGTSLIYSTYLGGASIDAGIGIAVDSAGSAYVTGRTLSSNFPLQAAIQGSLLGTRDAFVTKLSAIGALIYSTYLGGGGQDEGLAVAVDSANQAYVTGTSGVPTFPACALPCVSTALGPLGGNDAFVVKFNAAGSALLYTTFLGGGGNDTGLGIAVDSGQNVYVTGVTQSNNFPTAAAFQPSFGGGSSDAFVSKLVPGGGSLAYSTYLGGTGSENFVPQVAGIATDNAGNAYIVGSTDSTDFPTLNPIQPTQGGIQDAFVAKLTVGGQKTFATYLGGGAFDMGKAIAVDGTGNIYVTGQTLSINFPTVDPYQAQLLGGIDIYVTEFKSDGSGIIYSTYLGGTGDENSGGIATDSLGSAYVAGWTFSGDFPLVTPFQNQLKGSQDAFVSKFLPVAVTLSSLSPVAGLFAGGQNVTITGKGFVPGQTNVTFGGVPATGVIVNDSNSLIATPPARTPTPDGSHVYVDIVITTPEGTAFGIGEYAYGSGSITHPLVFAVPETILSGGSATILGSGFTPGSVVKLFVPNTAGKNPDVLPPPGFLTPVGQSPTSLTFNVPATLYLGEGYVAVSVVNTDQGFPISNDGGAVWLGTGSQPTLTMVHGAPIAAASRLRGIHRAFAEAVVPLGIPVTMQGSAYVSGPPQSALTVFSAFGGTAVFPPSNQITSTTLTATVPGSPTVSQGPGSLLVSNPPTYADQIATTSNGLTVALGSRIRITGASLVGNQVTVTGQGFAGGASGTVINLFAQQGGGTVNLGGLDPNTGNPKIPLNVNANGTSFTFTLPGGAQSGPAFVQALNAPFIPFTTASDAAGAFTIP